MAPDNPCWLCLPLQDLHVELTQLQYLPGSFTPYERMRLRYKHGQLRLIYDL